MNKHLVTKSYVDELMKDYKLILDKIPISEIEKYLRKRKLENINKNI